MPMVRTLGKRTQWKIPSPQFILTIVCHGAPIWLSSATMSDVVERHPQDKGAAPAEVRGEETVRARLPGIIIQECVAKPLGKMVVEMMKERSSR